MITPLTKLYLKLAGFNTIILSHWQNKDRKEIQIVSSRHGFHYKDHANFSGSFNECQPEDLDRELQNFLKREFGVKVVKLSKAQIKALIMYPFGYTERTSTALVKKGLAEESAVHRGKQLTAKGEAYAEYLSKMEK